MFSFIQYLIFFIVLFISQVSTQNYLQPSLTCYTKYENEETRHQTSNAVLNYAYSQAEITGYATPEGELCSNVGCACFSYQSSCVYSLQESNYISPCTDAERQGRVIKWYRGLTSYAKCEQMRQQPQRYLNLTCCNTNRCNDQPGKITKFINTQVSSQLHNTYGYKAPQSLSISQNQPTQRYNSHVYHPTTSPVLETYKSSSIYNTFSTTTNSLSSNYFSYWMIIFAFSFHLLITVRFH